MCSTNQLRRLVAASAQEVGLEVLDFGQNRSSQFAELQTRKGSVKFHFAISPSRLPKQKTVEGWLRRFAQQRGIPIRS